MWITIILKMDPAYKGKLSFFLGVYKALFALGLVMSTVGRPLGVLFPVAEEVRLHGFGRLGVLAGQPPLSALEYRL